MTPILSFALLILGLILFVLIVYDMSLRWMNTVIQSSIRYYFQVKEEYRKRIDNKVSDMIRELQEERR